MSLTSLKDSVEEKKKYGSLSLVSSDGVERGFELLLLGIESASRVPSQVERLLRWPNTDWCQTKARRYTHIRCTCTNGFDASNGDGVFVGGGGANDSDIASSD
jgi:hypothetical protein